jgi:ribosomal protein L18E
VKLDGRALRSAANDVAVLQGSLTGDALAVHKGAVRAAEIADHERAALAEDGGMT